MIYWEAEDPWASLNELATSENPFDVWFRARFSAYHSVDPGVLLDIIRENMLIADYPTRRTPRHRAGSLSPS